MLRLAHIVHPVVVASDSDLVIAQPITFETLRLACAFTMPQDTDTTEVSLLAIQYRDEERVPLPDCFVRVPDLQRSVADVARFEKPRKMALLADILCALFEVSTGADYLIYSNVDIAVQPYFYTVVSRLIKRGYDAFVINRRCISDRFTSPEQIPFMYSETGSRHKGYDCFVFRRDVFPHFQLGLVCLGTPWVDRALLANLVLHSQAFREFDDVHLTFHIGNTRQWLQAEFNELVQHNRNEFLAVFERLLQKHGGIDPVRQSYLLDQGEGTRRYPQFPDL